MIERQWSTKDPEIAWLTELTTIPTAAGREDRVIAWIERWISERSDLKLARDDAGNLIVSFVTATSTQRPLYITAHLDHPAFVVERVLTPTTAILSFRGGVLDAYFHNARVRLFSEGGEEFVGTITEKQVKEPFHECTAEFEAGARVLKGDIARWDLPAASIEGDLIHTHACDDLSAVAAALATMERLRNSPQAGHTRLLFTRAEEIGFIGAIAACKLGTIPKDAQVIALENSRSFAESPIGAGPIVRVGDRISVFHPGLVGAVSHVAESLAKESGGTFKWQRKLMPGGACEASTFQVYGYEAMCVCVPLGNYHNMASLDRVQAMKPDEAISSGLAVPGREYISISDYIGMIELLVACATGSGLDGTDHVMSLMERLHATKSFVLEE